MKLIIIVCLGALCSVMTGCGSMLSSVNHKLSSSLEAGVVNSADPQMVKSALPAYILMIDGLIENNPHNASLLLSGAKLNSIYASQFVDDQRRRQHLSQKALNYAQSALCAEMSSACDLRKMPFDHLKALVTGLEHEDFPLFFTVATSWVSWIQAHSSDWNAVADLARVNLILKHITEHQSDYEQGRAHLYLAVLSSLIPPALGGKPEEAQFHFDKAIELSQGLDLFAKFLYAKHYARLMFDRELHDQLLTEVMDAHPKQPGFTLSNVIAQNLSKQLLADAEEYF